MKRITYLLDLKKSSILILIYPYITTNLANIYNSSFYALSNLLMLGILLLTIEICYKIASLFKKCKYTNLIFLTIIIAVFYGFYFVSIIQNILGDNIRGRFIIPVICLLIFTFLYFIEIKNRYKLFNIYLLILGTIAFTSHLKEFYQEKKFIENLSSNYIDIGRLDKTEKPILLIITDEYSSPIELFSKFKDSSVFSFSHDLQKNNWSVKENFYTYETSTIHSISSLFNFNLSKGGRYNNYEIYDIGVNKLRKAKLYDTLINKKISIINYGIFDIGKIKPLNRIYFYPKNLFEQFFSYSSIFHIIYNTDNLSFWGIKSDFFPTEKHNKYILKNLKKELSKLNYGNYFCYVHLYMPHAPYQFKPYFKGGKANIENYYKYWNFTNEKLKELLIQLSKTNKYRIILTGDHGFRNETKINAHYTFSAFYGFDDFSLKKIYSVQDLGSLVNSYY